MIRVKRNNQTYQSSVCIERNRERTLIKVYGHLLEEKIHKDSQLFIKWHFGVFNRSHLLLYSIWLVIYGNFFYEIINHMMYKFSIVILCFLFFFFSSFPFKRFNKEHRKPNMMKNKQNTKQLSLIWLNKKNSVLYCWLSHSFQTRFFSFSSHTK